jgi:hypothetical protein
MDIGPMVPVRSGLREVRALEEADRRRQRARDVARTHVSDYRMGGVSSPSKRRASPRPNRGTVLRDSRDRIGQAAGPDALSIKGPTTVHGAGNLARYAPASGPVCAFLQQVGTAFLDLHEHILTYFGAGQQQPVGALARPIERAAGRSRFQVLDHLVEKDVVQSVAENPRIPLEETLPVGFGNSLDVELFLNSASAARFAATA